jgi:hypothetical protein
VYPDVSSLAAYFQKERGGEREQLKLSTLIRAK